MYTHDTIRLIVEFKDFNGNAITPTDIKLTIYDVNEEIVEVIEQDINKDDNRYYYDYVAQNDFIFEFSGIYDNKPVLARKLQKTKFI